MKHITQSILALSVGTTLAIGAPTAYRLDSSFDLSVTPTAGYDGQSASKGKLVRLEYSDGMGGFNVVLVSVFGDAQGPDVWGADGGMYPAKDLFVTRSMDNGATWSQPINVSNTANLTSITADNDGDPLTPAIAYYGDSEKPNIFNVGKNLIISWIDRYAPGGDQRTVTYPEFGLVEMPYAVTYCVRSTDAGVTWSEPEILSNGERDAKQDVSKGSSAGFLITWQEDPKGLQPGDADGPGEGGSGANVSKGTDIWYTALRMSDFTAGNSFPAATRITNNFTMTDRDDYESGREGAARANSFLFGSTAIIAYEETKGLEGLDTGKYIRYHTFSAFDDSNPDPTNGVGWILSTPNENARRVRFVTQPGPLQGQSDVRIVWVWKEGAFDNGGPSDIMCRVGSKDLNDPMSTGLRPQDLNPPIDPDATTRVNAFNNALGMNLSSSMGLAAHPEDNFFEDSRAHRGLLRGDFLAFGWSWTPDWAVARYTDLENYNFYMRRSFDGGMTWTDPENMSNIPAESKENVREPRIVGAPSSSNPSTPQNPGAFVVAWGTELNQYEHASVGTIDHNIFLTHTDDFGASYAPVVQLDDVDIDLEPNRGAFESQLRLSPSGDRVFAVWQEADRDLGVTNTLFRNGTTCLPDFNGDGSLDFLDVSAFLNAFSLQDPAADFSGDGRFDYFDVSSFLTAFSVGCP